METSKKNYNKYINNFNSHVTREFELLPVSEILNVKEERFNYLQSIASYIINYHQNKLNHLRTDKRYNNSFSIKLGYHLASTYLNQVDEETLSLDIGKEVLEFENSGEKSLFAMLICDNDCKYFTTYQNKIEEGLNNAEALGILDEYYGIKSAKLIQIERYYFALLSRYERKKNESISIFENVDEIKPVK